MTDLKDIEEEHKKISEKNFQKVDSFVKNHLSTLNPVLTKDKDTEYEIHGETMYIHNGNTAIAYDLEGTSYTLSFFTVNGDYTATLIKTIDENLSTINTLHLENNLDPDKLLDFILSHEELKTIHRDNLIEKVWQ